jgi:hypothetical protein
VYIAKGTVAGDGIGAWGFVFMRISLLVI